MVVEYPFVNPFFEKTWEYRPSRLGLSTHGFRRITVSPCEEIGMIAGLADESVCPTSAQVLSPANRFFHGF